MEQKIMINLDFLTDSTKEKANLVLDEINEYVNTECVFKKMELLIKIKKTTELSFNELEFILLESWRTLKRVFDLQFITSEIKDMYYKKQITKPIAYALSKLKPHEQYILYVSMNELLKVKKAIALEKIKQCEPYSYKIGTKKLQRIGYNEFVELKEKALKSA